MNARRKRRFRCAQRISRRQANMPLVRTCPRCQRSFSPEWKEAIGQWSRCCAICSFANLVENLGLEDYFPALMKAAKQRQKQAEKTDNLRLTPARHP